jgi:hypothetical protein
VLALLDGALTLHGQPAEYWRGDWGLAVEANPPFRWLLRQHPLAFVAGGAAWVAAFLALLRCAPANLARVLAFVVLVAHALGAASWLAPWGLPGYALCVLLFALAARATRWTWRRGRRAEARSGGAVGRLPEQEGDALAQQALAAQAGLTAVGLPEAEDGGNGQSGDARDDRSHDLPLE